MDNLPNILTTFRIPLSLALLLLQKHPYLFSLCYLLCGISDILDGYFARRFNRCTPFGATFDSIADGVFYAVLALLLFFHTDLYKESLTLWLLLGVTLFRLINLMITHRKFHKKGMLHTWANKTTGLLTFIIFPLYLLGLCTLSLIWAVTCVAFFATLEECILLLRLKQYDPNKKGLFF